MNFETKILPCASPGIAAAVKFLQQGEVVALPTETVYGLAADATNLKAIERIYAAKGRPKHNPLIIHVPRTLDSLAALASTGLVEASQLSESAAALSNRLIAEFWPGPLTLVLPKGKNVPDIITSGSKFVALRMPAHSGFLAVLQSFAGGLAAPSANRFCSLSPTTAEHVRAELFGRIPLILDGGPCQSGIESTILKVLDTGKLRLLRKGATPLESLKAFGEIFVEEAGPELPIEAPGMLSRHYSPKKPMWICTWESVLQCGHYLTAEGSPQLDLLVVDGRNHASLILRLQEELPHLKVHFLSPEGNAEDAAQHLYEVLRRLDNSASIAIIAVQGPEQSHSLFAAINDRLNRGGTKFESLPKT